VALPNAAAAGVWMWGHNYIGQGVNGAVRSPLNYYTDQYIHKHGGGSIGRGWQHSDTLVCGYTWLDGGPVAWYRTAAELGCGGYMLNTYDWGSGASSYLYTDSYYG
jgi:hypothetical protein